MYTKTGHLLKSCQKVAPNFGHLLNLNLNLLFSFMHHSQSPQMAPHKSTGIMFCFTDSSDSDCDDFARRTKSGLLSAPGALRRADVVVVLSD